MAPILFLFVIQAAMETLQPLLSLSTSRSKFCSTQSTWYYTLLYICFVTMMTHANISMRLTKFTRVRIYTSKFELHILKW